KRRDELDQIIMRPDFYQDQRRAAELSREHQKLQSLIELYAKLQKLERDIVDNQVLVEETKADPDLKSVAEEGLKDAVALRAALRERVLVAMLPPDPSDSRNTVFEIRAGAGGDEASLFAADLHRMYSRFAEERGWKVEPMGASPSECGGVKEVTFLIVGQDVYKTLKYESGVHRVQRVPATEASGRIHTSTATVAVLPEAEEVDIEIKADDLEISVCRASGPGGQGVNTTDSAVQIHHKPSGMIVTCADERSQQKNKVKAMKVLRSRLLQIRADEERLKYAANRRSQIGTGDRSERIRTYNFPQNRLTDHRIGLTLYNLPQVMEGQLDPLIDGLKKADYEARIQMLLDKSS
ncbi:MAG TPA: peptide chain release factor 1, partial [Opitutales bacterium]|nr:peptide chain release factor 1 [Opitutales bacterium]